MAVTVPGPAKTVLAPVVGAQPAVCWGGNAPAIVVLVVGRCPLRLHHTAAQGWPPSTLRSGRWQACGAAWTRGLSCRRDAHASAGAGVSSLFLKRGPFQELDGVHAM